MSMQQKAATPCDPDKSSQGMLDRARDRKATPFDYIIVGSGAGGGPLAVRLAESGKTVLLIESGGDTAAIDPTEPEKLKEVYEAPGYHAAATEDTEMSWMFSVRHYSSTNEQVKDSKYNKRDTESNAVQTAGNAAESPPQPPDKKFLDGTGIRGGLRGIFYPRSSGLGGCTSHHAMIVVAPNEKDWDHIAELTGDDSWRAENMHGYFTKLERCQYIDRYQRFLSKLGGLIYKGYRRLVLLFDPRAILDDGGHGSNSGKGWQPTSFIDPDLVSQIEKSDRNFVDVLMQSALAVLHSDNKLLSLWKRALVWARVVQQLDFNDLNTRRASPEGVFLIPIGTKGSTDPNVASGIRYGVRERLVNAQKSAKERLVIATNFHVVRVVFEAGKDGAAPRAIGVEGHYGEHLYRASPIQNLKADEIQREQPLAYFTVGEIILCGGAFNTPQLLMLSGIGDREHLTKVGINGPAEANGEKVGEIVHLPGVGRNLQDRYEVSVISELANPFETLNGVSFTPGVEKDKAHIQWTKDKTGLYATNGGTLAILRRSSAAKEKKERESDVFTFGAPVAFRGYYWGWSRELLSPTMGAPSQNRNLWSWIILKAYTTNNTGTVRLLSTNPFDTPGICFNSFSDAEANNDLDALVNTIEFIRTINSKNSRQFVNEIQPGKNVPDPQLTREQIIKGELNDSPLGKWIKKEAWGHHACGTCRIGSDAWQAQTQQLRDKMAVLDSHFRVHGVRGLRVVDASVFPKIPGYFIVTPIFMISEKAADTILSDSTDYPDRLAEEELAAIGYRRQTALVAPPTDAPEPVPGRVLPPDAVGIALSGGGIRSATFCLGVLQALAKKNRLRQVDLMSTVSGGGYIGGFLGRLYSNVEKDVKDKAGRVQDIIADSSSAQIKWLRENANYLAGEGSADVQLDLAVLWRNLLTVHLIIGILAIAVFCISQWLSHIVASFLPVLIVPTELTQSAILNSVKLPQYISKNLQVSDWLWLPIVWFTLAVLPASIGFWLAYYSESTKPYPKYAILSWIAALFAAVAAFTLPGVFLFPSVGLIILVAAYIWQELSRLGLPDDGGATIRGTILRNRLTRSLGEAMFTFVLMVLFVILDSTAKSAAKADLAGLLTGLLMLMAPFLPIARALTLKLQAVAGVPRSGQPVSVFASWTAGAVAFSVLFSLLVVADVLVYKDFWAGSHWEYWLLISTVAFSAVVARATGFLNLSSLHSYYAARLTRTFLGASNRRRIFGSDTGIPLDVSLAHPDDDIAYGDYHPETNGGPLHLLNVCVNETIDLASQRDVRERKGLSMCMGPKGVSVGRRFHALWKEISRQDNGDKDKLPPGLEALPASPNPNAFHVFSQHNGKPAPVESLRLGQWIAISGAAVSTGLGRVTSLPLALLCGLFNVRLGYWWDSGIDPYQRPGRYPPSLAAHIRHFPALLFRMQSILLNEWRASFPGPSYRFWYLTDGGHFENTAMYELVRRRVPLIIAIDGGEDPKYSFGDLSLLTRLVRIDFGAEINWVNPKDGVTGWADIQAVCDQTKTTIPMWVQHWIDAKVLGRRDAFSRKNRSHCAALAYISYTDDKDHPTWLLYIKACLDGNEPVDVTEYAVCDEAFPNDSTENQFFDGAQWGAYRLLGEYIGTKVFE